MISLKVKNKKLKKVGRFFKKLPLILGERAFLTCLILFFIAMVLGAFVFYKYCFLVEKKEPKFTQTLLYLDDKKLQAIIKAWQDRQAKFDAANSKQYLNPFMLK